MHYTVSILKAREKSIERAIHQNLSFTRLMLLIAIVQPIMTIPQIQLIWWERQTAGLSFFTWSFYALAAAVWLLYGLRIRDRPLILSSGLWLVVDLIIVAGLIFV